MIGIFIFIVLVTGIEIKFSPRLSYVKSCKRLLLWYNSKGKYSDDRDYIILYEV